MEKKAYSCQPVADNAPSAPPLFSSAVSYGNLLFLAGVGAHFKGTIEEHTKHVLDELEKNLQCAGSSMDKVLKVNVYLNDIKDWARMNTVYAGRLGQGAAGTHHHRAGRRHSRQLAGRNRSHRLHLAGQRCLCPSCARRIFRTALGR